MPIKGLTDQVARFPQIGQLRKGAAKTGNRPGADLKYFRFDSQHKDVTAAFNEAYGNAPAAINVFLPFATPEQNFSAWQEEYRAGGLVHRCDGETMTQWLTESGTYSQTPKPCPYHSGEKERTKKNPGCKAVGRLMVIIPELERLAYVMVGTTSINDIMELTSNLIAAYALRGDLTGIPFVLRRMPRMISTPSGSDGNRARREKWLLFLEPAPEWVGLQFKAMSYNALPSVPNEKQLSLPSPETITVDAETGEIVDEDDEIIDADPVILTVENNGNATETEPANNGNGPQRPFDAVETIAALHTTLDHYSKINLDDFSDKQKGGLAGTLQDMCGGEEQRHSFLYFVFGKNSMNELVTAELMTLKRWIDIKKIDDEWMPNADSVEEAKAVVKFAESQMSKKQDGAPDADLITAAKQNPDSIHAEEV